MEKRESPSKHRKNKGINIGGNIGGLVVLGGALAVAGLIAVVAVKRRRGRRRDADKDLPCQKEVKGSQGVRFTPQNPSSTFHQNPCLTDGSTGMFAEETQIDSIELDSTESLILEENSASMINDEYENFASDNQEILLTDDPEQEMIIPSRDDCFGVEELHLPVLDSESMNEVEDKIKNDSEENLSWLEETEMERQKAKADTESIMEEETKSVNLVVEEEEEPEIVEGEGEEDEEGHGNEEYVMEEEAVGAEKLNAETTVAIHLFEVEEEDISEDEEEEDEDSSEDEDEEEEEDEDSGEDEDEEEEEDSSEDEDEEEEDSSEEYLMDEGDESSEGTGITSAETKAEAIWPAESIGVLSSELKNTIINTQSSGEEIVEEDGSTKTEELGDSIVALPLEVKKTSVNLQSSESKEKIVDEDRNNKTKEFGDFKNSKSNILDNDTDNHETSKNPMNNQTAARRKIWVCAMLLQAVLLLLLFTHRNALYYRFGSSHVP